MADVFISYKREDRGAIEQLNRALRGLKLDVWFDASLNAGEAFSEEINREARAAKSIVVCWSPAARESRWVLAEALIGFEADKLAAARVNSEPFVIPAPFNILHVEDISDWLVSPDNSDQAWRGLVRRIGKLCGRPELESGAALDVAPPVPRVTDVFAEAKPTYTFIDRSTKPEFRRIQRELLAGGKIIRLHGPSKSGKTELCRQIFQEASPILLYGSQIQSVDSYWGSIAQQLDVSVTEAPFACARQRRALIIDNFHDVDRRLQGPLIKSFRPFMDEKGTVVLISVPDVAEVFLEIKRGRSTPDPVIGELLARSVPEEAPKWTEGEIRRIADVGFRTLKVRVTDKTLSVLTRFAFRNPLLMQKHCSELCFNLGIDEALATERQPSINEQHLRETFQRVASIDGAIFHRIATRGAKAYQTAGGKKLSLRELVLLAVSRTNVNVKIGSTRIANNIAQMLDEKSPRVTAADVRKAVTELIAEMYALGQSGLVLDAANFLYIAHPFFKSYLVWVLAPHCGAPMPDLERYVEPQDAEQHEPEDLIEF